MVLGLEASGRHCIRCGECCLKSSPTLHADDLRLIKEGRILKRHLYAIRPGELVRDNIQHQLKITEIELVKVKEKGVGQGCIYYDHEGKVCRIYEHRPSQCSAFLCRDDRAFVRVYESPKLDRKGIIQDKALSDFIEQHEKKCGYHELEKLVMRIEAEGEKAVDGILSLLKFDHELRPLVSEKMGVAAGEMDLIFGRPLAETIAMFGLQVIKQPDGSFFLTADQSP